MKKRIFITGAKGFLGNALWRFIEERGLPFELFGFSRHKKHASKKMITGELNNQKDLCRVLSLIRPDYIFHFAGGRVPQEDKMFESNFMTSKILFESIKMMPHYQPRIVIPGTAAEYGRVAWKKKVDEAMPTKPISWYGFVKCMQTELSLLYARRGLNITIARMFNVLGAGAPPVLAIGKFAQDIVMIEKGIKPPIIQTKDLSGRRDFLDIEDVCAALLLVGQYGKTGEIYNICAGKYYLMRGLLRQLIKYSKVKNIQIEEDCRNASDSYDVRGSNRKIMNTMGWKPRVSIEKSLNDTLNYYRTLYKTKP